MLLSKRERAILHALTEGQTNSQIAGSLGMTEASVKSYLDRIFKRLGVITRSEAIIWAKSNDI